MATPPAVLPTARVFAGPDDKICEFNRIWVVLYADATRAHDSNYDLYGQFHRLIIGRDGEDCKDLELLTHILGLDSKGTASASRLHTGKI